MIRTLLAVASAAAVLAAPAFAQDTGPAGPSSYVQAHVGISTVSDDGVDVVFVEPDGSTFTERGAIDYDTGYGFGALFGYHLAPAFAVEAEISGRANDFEGNIGDEDLVITTFMANAVLTVPGDLPVVPYVGAGLGLASSNLEETGNSFAYQAKGGLRVPLSGPHGVGVEAAYLKTSGFEIDEAGLDLDYANVSVMATYTYSFGY